MVDLLWFVLTLILLAAETVVLVLLLVLRWKTPRTDTRETRTEYLQPNYNEVAGFRLAAYPDNEIITPALLADRKCGGRGGLCHCAGPRHEPAGRPKRHHAGADQPDR